MIEQHLGHGLGDDVIVHVRIQPGNEAGQQSRGQEGHLDELLPGLAGKVAYAQLLNDAREVPFKEAGADRNWDEQGLNPGSVLFYLPVEKPRVTVPVLEIFLKSEH